MKQRTLGNKFEQELCDTLSKGGFWVHNIAQNQAGQPADIIAVKRSMAFLIDAKVCSDDTFALSRIEENQHYSMLLWKSCGNSSGWFALKLSSGIYMMSLSHMLGIDGVSSFNKKFIETEGIRLERWMQYVDELGQ